jgi:hypothetical protein
VAVPRPSASHRPSVATSGGVALGDVADVPEADPVLGWTCGFSVPVGYRFLCEVIVLAVRW